MDGEMFTRAKNIQKKAVVIIVVYFILRVAAATLHDRVSLLQLVLWDNNNSPAGRLAGLPIAETGQPRVKQNASTK